MALATLMATDAFFTLCTNNLWGTMSDKYGRKPFMCMSAVGIALGAALISSSSSVALWFLGAAVDGCTSCMFGIGQAYVSDISGPEELAGNIGLFMGLAAGVSFMFGIPISAILAAKVGYSTDAKAQSPYQKRRPSPLPRRDNCCYRPGSFDA